MAAAIAWRLWQGNAALAAPPARLPVTVAAAPVLAERWAAQPG